MLVLPLFLVWPKGERVVPLPGSYTVMSLTAEEKEHFNCIPIYDESEEDFRDLFLLGFSEESGPYEKLSGNQIARTYPVTLLCRLYGQDDENLAFLVLSSHVLDADKIQIRLEDNEISLWAEVDPKPRNSPQSFPQLDQMLKSLAGMDASHPRFGESIKEAKRLQTDTTLSADRKIHILANLLLVTNTRRLKYLMTRGAIERCILLAEAMADTPNAENRKLARSKPKKKIKTLKDRWEEADLPDDVRDQADRDFRRLHTLQKTTSEYAQLLEYINWILDIPWGRHTAQKPDLLQLKQSLNETHYGLTETKQHILEHFAIEQVRKKKMGMVLCLIGPHGTGKTTLAKSIAAASGRSLQHVALGGVRDESILRGHRRTYVASRPGRIVNCLKMAGSMDPLILLDEIDKIDPYNGSSVLYALLELLDPEQNKKFTDHYLEVPLDLSKALFVCTANYKERIPPELADRIEFVEFREYSQEERFEILKHYILPKVLKDYEITSLPIQIEEASLVTLSKIHSVREIERTLRKLLRTATYEILMGAECFSLDRENVEAYTSHTVCSTLGF